MSKFSWETYGRQRQQRPPIEPVGFFASLRGYMKDLFRLARNYTRHD